MRPPVNKGEEWRNVPARFGRYAVSSQGRVFSFLSGRLISASVGSNGYAKIGLQTPAGRRFLGVHRLMCETFKGAPLTGQEVAHLDGDPLNNSLQNLAWVSHRENLSHRVQHGTAPRGKNSGRAKLTDKSVAQIRADIRDGVRICDIARKNGVVEGAIHNIRAGLTWGWLE